MRRIITFCLMLMPIGVMANTELASRDYVDRITSDKVDTAATATQTMAGSYTVSGTLVVPTPPLPTAE